jgi:hypothetical protein
MATPRSKAVTMRPEAGLKLAIWRAFYVEIACRGRAEMR